MRLATRLLTHSDYCREELQRTAGFDATVLHLGVPDSFGSLPEGDARPCRADRLERRPDRAGAEGPAPVRRGGRHAPELEFVLVGTVGR